MFSENCKKRICLVWKHTPFTFEPPETGDTRTFQEAHPLLASRGFNGSFMGSDGTPISGSYRSPSNLTVYHVLYPLLCYRSPLIGFVLDIFKQYLFSVVVCIFNVTLQQAVRQHRRCWHAQRRPTHWRAGCANAIWSMMRVLLHQTRWAYGGRLWPLSERSMIVRRRRCDSEMTMTRQLHHFF